MGLFRSLFSAQRKQENWQVNNLARFLMGSYAVSAQSFQMINGGKIGKNTPYMLPKDGNEISRLDLQHYMLRSVMQGNYVAPISKNTRTILDVGCGTGCWAQEMALEFPMSLVVGCDLVEQRTEQIVAPPNYRFIEADALKGLPFADQSFDIVHQRLLFLAIPLAEWQREINELVRLTRPKGWVELLETQLTVQDGGPICSQISEWTTAISRMNGIDAAYVPDIERYLHKAGLKNVFSRRYSVPLGTWGGYLGSMMATDTLAALKAFKPMVVSKLNVSSDDFDRLVTSQVQEWDMFHPNVTFFIACGQK